MGVYIKHRTATKIKMHGEEVLDIPSKFVYSSLIRNKNHPDNEILGIEQQLYKLLKQCFAIAKSGRPYDEDYVSIMSK